LGVDVADAETGFEITYSDQITPWLRVQPDLQLVVDPGGDQDRDELWVAGLRIEITPSWGGES
jgi:porin